MDISPILADAFLEKTTFHLIASFNSIEDIHKLTLLQLIYLSKGKRMRVTMKLGQSVGDEMEKQTGFTFVRERCEKTVER